jgi:tetratricopeptide (TPR) repeat protein/TolB-like protein
VLSKAQQDDLVMGLVEQVLARPVEEREAFLNKACADDTELFNEVWRYVDAEERMNGFLLEPLYPATSLEHSIKPGEILDGRFRIVREIARGGMGIVYEAVDQKLDRRIALKCAKTGFDKRLLPEVRHASEISHPNVCKIFEIHTASTTEGEIDFITMEFLEGETLSERLRRGIPSEEARTIAQQLCAGLAEAHRNNVVHGDLKSNNVILTTSAEGSVRAVITDFGLARRTESSQRTRQSGVAGGTPAYMAPELWKGEKASPASDVFALGVILHELASGQLPFGSETTVLEGERPRRVPRVSGPFRKWDAIVTRCLNPDPRKRFRTSAEVGIALAPSRASRWVAVAAAAILLAIVSSVVTYQRATTPAEVLRLAVLPFDGDEESKALRDGLLLDTEERLRGVKPSRLRLTVVPLTDAIQNRVDQPARARTMLGATHSLSGEVHKRNGRVRVRAYLSDTRSLAHLAEWQTEYGEDDLRDMPVALAGLVTGALRLPPLIAMPSVKAAAYADYVAGVSLARRDSNLDLAIPLLERAVQADPDSPLTHASLADAEFSKYRVTREPEWKRRAFESLKKAEQRNPDVALVRFVSGTINDDEGQYEQAQADFQRAIELDPNNGDAWRRLGNAYNDDNQPNRALAAYMKAIEVQPDYYRNYQFLGEFYFTRGDYDGAINQYRRMVELAPDLPAAHYQLATPYLNTGRYTEAEQELNISIGLRETAVAVEGLGVSRMYQDQNREAIPYFQRALEIGPKTSLRYLNLGTVFRRAGFARESRDAYQNGLDLAEANLATNPRDAYEKSCLAYLCARLGDRRRAEAEIAQALQLARGANNVRWMAALTYEALGVHDRTLAAVEDAPKSLLDRLNRFPDLADLRALPRFQELIASHGTR